MTPDQMLAFESKKSLGLLFPPFNLQKELLMRPLTRFPLMDRGGGVGVGLIGG